SQEAVLAQRRAMAGQVKFVIGLFDTSYNRKLYNNQAHISEFYRSMLLAVRARPSWGCIIKTKSNVYDNLPLTPGVQDVVAELQQQGRCIVLEGTRPPSALAKATDAVVSCNINMAGHLVAMHGVPALYLDYSGQYYVNWYDLPQAGKCFFTDAGAVIGAL